MVFGRKKNNLELELAYLKGKLEALEKLQSQPQPQPAPTTLEQVEPDIAKATKIRRRLENLSWAAVEKRLQALEARLKNSPQNQIIENLDIQENTENNPNSSDIERLISNPMIKIAINSFLRNYGTSIDDLKNDPSKLIELLENITNTLKQKKSEAEQKGQTFNPYDPNLFMKK